MQFFLCVLDIEPIAVCVPSALSTTKLHSQTLVVYALIVLSLLHFC